MRKTLEDFYYGNITPNTQDMAPHSELKRAVERVALCEKQLEEILDEPGQTILPGSSDHSRRSTASQPWKTSFWVSGWA